MFVMTIDQNRSSTGGDRVPELLRTLEAIGRASAAAQGTAEATSWALPPERTVGDEVQAITAHPPTLIASVRAALRLGGWQIGVGIGEVAAGTTELASTREARGAAFIAAREAVEQSRSKRLGVPVVVRGVVGESARGVDRGAARKDALGAVREDARGVVCEDAPGAVREDARGVVCEDAPGAVREDARGVVVSENHSAESEPGLGATADLESLLRVIGVLVQRRSERAWDYIDATTEATGETTAERVASWAVATAETRPRVEVAAELGVSTQAVSTQLRRAAWAEEIGVLPLLIRLAVDSHTRGG